MMAFYRYLARRSVGLLSVQPMQPYYLSTTR